ncbi:ABC transporter permease, partial [Klebsiella pneumoniae]|nr:ABC transporter permease [Klebsiella pneumoniae]
MTMAIVPAQAGRVSGIFWRRPALGLFLLLRGPLM